VSVAHEPSPMMPLSEGSSLRTQLFAVWCAPICSILVLLGWMILARGARPAAAALTARETAAFFIAHQQGMLIGTLVFAIGCCFLAIWTVQLGIMIWRIEGRAPVMAITEILCGASIVIIVVLNCSFWAAAAYRPGVISPEIVQAENDTAWLGFLFVGWPLLSLQMISTAVAALRDRGPRPLFPRRLSQAALGGSVIMATAAGCGFTKTGPFAFDGVLGYFLPLVIWAAWLNLHAWYMRAGLRRQLGPEGSP
jgi:hypothetical protein